MHDRFSWKLIFGFSMWGLRSQARRNLVRRASLFFDVIYEQLAFIVSFTKDIRRKRVNKYFY